MPTDDRTEKLLRELAANVREGSIDIIDLHRFYSFVVTAAQCRKQWSATDVSEKLLQLGVSEERSEALGTIYGHCRAALYLHGKGSKGINGWSKFLS